MWDVRCRMWGQGAATAAPKSLSRKREVPVLLPTSPECERAGLFRLQERFTAEDAESAEEGGKFTTEGTEGTEEGEGM
jgi:hypothetical protein